VILTSRENNLRHVSIGAAGAVGAVTLMWAGWLCPVFFQLGTMLLIICLVPLASVLNARGGIMLGMLFGAVWIAARFGMVDTLDQEMVLTQTNVTALLAMMGVGALSGILLNIKGGTLSPDSQMNTNDTNTRTMGSTIKRFNNSDELPSSWREALARHREWMNVHLREYLQILTGAKRIRCFRVGQGGQLYPLSRKDSANAISLEQNGLLSHVLTSGRRFLAASDSTPPMIQELAQAGTNPPAWAIPVYYQNRPIGLVTVDQFEEPQDEQHLQLAADLMEEFWQHVYQADQLRIAHLKDRASGVLNRIEFLCLLDEMVQRSYESYEPVVVMVLCLEGLRGLDDEGQWDKRDGVIESVGQVICDGVRKDDIVGRFSDSLFVTVLRRLDISLAELICKKLMNEVGKSIAHQGAEKFITLRAGLAGSGLDQVSSENLMLQAFSALQSAREDKQTMVSTTAKVNAEEVRS